MSIDRVATSTQSSLLLNQIQKQESDLNTTELQISSGDVSNTYSGIGDKVAMLEASRSAANMQTAYQSATNLALNQANLQDTQMSSLSDIANQLRSAITTAVGNNDGSTLMDTVSGLYDQVVQILNSTDANGNYLYGGDQNSQPPVTATSLDDLTSLSSVSDAFQNGTVANSVTVGDGQTVQVGMLASDVGTQLLQTFKDLADMNASSSFGTTLTSSQVTDLNNEIQTATNAATQVNSAAASNGSVYNELQNASDNQTTMSNLFQGFVSNIQDVDMSTAITQLSQQQTALQASLEVTAQLNQVSLLNYLNPSS